MNTATAQEPVRFDRVAILSKSEDNLRRDRVSLKDFKPKTVFTFTSGAEAVTALDGEEVDLVLCDSELADMDGCKFIRILRQKPMHRATPVVMVTVAAEKNSVLDAIAAGCTGYVLRPYSPETFNRHMAMAQQVSRFSEIEEEQLANARELVDQGSFDEAIEEFEEILTLQDEAQKYYDKGCDYLFQQKYGKAIIAFNKAIKLNDLFAEAYQGLAEAYKGKGNPDKAKNFLQRAAEIHAQFDRMEEAKSLFIEVLKYDAEAPNPYNTLGVKLRRTGDYPGAIHAYQRAIELSPTDENVFFNLAKALYYMGDKKQSVDKLTTALSMNSDFPEAVKFYRDVTGREFPAELRTKAAPRKAAETIKDV
ncbi:MAG: tetratricopeptide repeat protein [Thermodesulfobacteriota bacterium]